MGFYERRVLHHPARPRYGEPVAGPSSPADDGGGPRFSSSEGGLDLPLFGPAVARVVALDHSTGVLRMASRRLTGALVPVSRRGHAGAHIVAVAGQPDNRARQTAVASRDHF
jgi:hypothetical protein